MEFEIYMANIEENLRSKPNLENLSCKTSKSNCAEENENWPTDFDPYDGNHPFNFMLTVRGVGGQPGDRRRVQGQYLNKMAVVCAGPLHKYW